MSTQALIQNDFARTPFRFRSSSVLSVDGGFEMQKGVCHSFALAIYQAQRLVLNKHFPTDSPGQLLEAAFWLSERGSDLLKAAWRCGQDRGAGLALHVGVRVSLSSAHGIQL